MQQSGSHVIVHDPQPRKWWRRSKWSPFDKCGNIRLVMVTDPWWMKLWAKVRGDGVWHEIGAYTDDQ